MHDAFDPLMEYFRNFSILTANDEHLSIIGVWQGLARPLIYVPDGNTFFFTEAYGYRKDPTKEGHLIPNTNFPSQRGFAEVGSDVGGVFAMNTRKTNYVYKQLDVVYRELLRAFTESDGELGSLTALDDMMYALWKRNHKNGEVPIYQFSWADDKSAFTIGDLFLDMGDVIYWEYPYEVYAQLKLFGQTLWFPMPQLIPILREGTDDDTD